MNPPTTLREVWEPDLPLDSEPVHNWFGLSYASYFAIPRAVLEQMPVEWQRRFITCLREIEDHLDWESLQPKNQGYMVKLRGPNGRFLPDPLSNYRHPRRIPRIGEPDEG